MVKKVIIAVSDDDTKKIVYRAAKNRFGEKQVVVCSTSTELYEQAKYVKDTAVIIDKFFFGYIISNRYVRLRVINETLLTYFVEIGECSPFFGMRIRLLGVTGYIPDIEVDEAFDIAMRRIQGGEETFPDDVPDPSKKNISRADKRCINEVTKKEMSVGIYLSMGRGQKEICNLTGMKPATVSLHVHRLFRKIGYKKPQDLLLLDKRTYFYSENDGGDFAYQD